MDKHICIVVPAFNEEASIDLFHTRTAAVAAGLPRYRWSWLFVDDGSTDATLARIQGLAGSDRRVGFVALSRNFGKEAALTAGLDHAAGDAVAIFDADLQDPPELLCDFVREWERGFDVVYARRADRRSDSWLKRTTAAAFYRFLGRWADVPVPAAAGDCRLMSRRALDALVQLRERHRFMKGLFAWVGFPAQAVDCRREPRSAGRTKFGYWRLWNLALEGLTSFSAAPLKLATYLGVAVALTAFAAGVWILVKTLLWGEPARGFPTLIVTMLFLGGVQLFFTGVLGEYLARVFGETKQRPLYLVREQRLPPAP